MITFEQYFGKKIDSPDATIERRGNAIILLDRVNILLQCAAARIGYAWWVDADTGTCISGSRGGAGDGGFRLGASTTGAANSKHKLGAAIDVYDPQNKLDDWLTTFDTRGGAGNTMLEQVLLYREAPEATNGWLHLQSMAPGSGRRTFKPF